MSEGFRDWVGTLEEAIVRIQGRIVRSSRKHCFNGHLLYQTSALASRACTMTSTSKGVVDSSATRPEKRLYG